jgi:asparagine N-glycosylation enzyme membrane subunit Stt3
MGVPDVKMLVAFGKVGIEMLASRILSLAALFGIIALAAYSVYAVSWIGASCVAILAVFTFIPAVKLESNRKENHDVQP